MAKQKLTPDEAWQVLSELSASAVKGWAAIETGTTQVEKTVLRQQAYACRSAAHRALDVYLAAKGFE